MGKDWDKALPRQEAFKQMHRILKPGGIAFVMSSPRQDVLWRMLRLLENSGFELKQSFVSWIYKTGFPKAYDVSKGIDKRKGRSRKIYDELGQFIKDRRIKLRFKQKDIAKLFPSKSGRLTGCMANWELGFNVPTKEQWNILKEKLKIKISKFDELIDRVEAERKVIGKDKHFGKDGILPWHGKEWNVTESSINLAKKWEGWKSITGLKPALECILMVNKPLSEPTIVDNVLKHGTGAINVDGCRIPYKSEGEIWEGKSGSYGVKGQNVYGDGKGYVHRSKEENVKGRFPANLIISDKAIDSGKISKSNERKVSKTEKSNKGYRKQEVYGNYKERQTIRGVNDIGDQSRYFDLDAWWNRQCIILDVPKPSKSERDKGCEKLEGKQAILGISYICSKCGISQRHAYELKNKGKCNHSWVSPKLQNFHPTVKPIKLMSYLIELGCSKEGIVLDPFVGSGTTCIAAKMLNRKWIGIEVNREYINIASARLDNCPIVEFKPSKQNIVKSIKEEKKEDWKNMFEVDD